MNRSLPMYSPPGAVPAAGATAAGAAGAVVAAPAEVAPVASAAVRPAPPMAATRARVRQRPRGPRLVCSDAIIAFPFSHPRDGPRRPVAARFLDAWPAQQGDPSPSPP